MSSKITLLPLSAIIPTRNRSAILQTTLSSLAGQQQQPKEVIIIDASVDSKTEQVATTTIANLLSRIVYVRATVQGAAPQRNQGIQLASNPAILFMDDDIIFEPGCIEKLWLALQSDPAIGGANAMITNQKYTSPGTVSRILYRILHGRKEKTYAGKCIGPGVNLLPEDRDDLPEIVRVDWLNSTCTIYKRAALPDPVFSTHFTGYSLMEDLALSLQVARKWVLVNARTARIFHDSQQGSHKSNIRDLARMEVVNRHFIMRTILGRKSNSDYLKFLIFQTFGTVMPLLRAKNWKTLSQVLAGKLSGLAEILRKNR